MLNGIFWVLLLGARGVIFPSTSVPDRRLSRMA
ncbi:hypothetical protein EBL84_09075 [Marichromatium sp. AB31]|nr:hypothetical protein EBL84_09075 [Marichromatium sp. AB31]